MPESTFVGVPAENARPAAGETVREAFPAACLTSAAAPPGSCQVHNAEPARKRSNVHVQARLPVTRVNELVRDRCGVIAGPRFGSVGWLVADIDDAAT